MKWAVLLAAVLACGCAGPSLSYKGSLRESIAAGDYAKAGARIEAAKEKEYGKKNAVLYYLDRAMALHDAGLYRESDADFDTAQRRMEELYTKSVTRSAGTLLINDNTTEYAGQPFEKALSSVFRALNYVFLGNTDEAVVEARKVSAFLDGLKRDSDSGYRDDAFAEYLSAMLFEEAGRPDDARICLAAAMTAYENYYGTPKPEFDVPADAYAKNGEIVFLHYNGVAPVKVSRTFQVAWNDALLIVRQSKDKEAEGQAFKNALTAVAVGKAITVAYPEYIDQPLAISGSEIEAGGISAPSQLMEDVSAIAKDELSREAAAQRARMIARAAIKYVLAKAAAKQAEERGGAGIGFLAKVAAGAFTSATEIADTRCWATLPAQIRMSRLILPPGTYDVNLVFKDKNGSVVSADVMRGVEVKQGKRTYLHYRTAR